jgi:HEAT repeat protein
VDEKREYAEIQPSSREELEEAFAGDDENAICNAVYSAAQHEPDWRWTQGELVRFLGHDSLLVRSTAMNALGELVLFRGYVDLEVVLPEIHKLEKDPALAPLVKEYMEDLKSRVTIH